MKGQTKAKLIVFFIVAIIAFATSSMAANIILIKNPNDNTLLAIEDTNLTNKTDWMNNANITNILNKTKGNLSNLWNEYSHW